MNLNDLNEAPLGILNRLGQKVLSKVPGSIGARAQGKLDTGAVANRWKRDFIQYLGRTGQKNPSTELLAGFFKSKGLSDDDISRIIEASMMYERVLTNKEVDQMILKVAQRAAGGSTTSRQEPPPLSTGPSIAPSPASTAASTSLSTPSTAPVSKVKSAASEKQTPTTGVNNYLNTWARDIKNASNPADKMALAREMIKFISDRQGTPQGKMMAKAAEMVIKRLGDPSLMNVVKGFKKFQMERANYIVASYILSEVGLSWKDIGMKIVLSESTSSYVTIAYR